MELALNADQRRRVHDRAYGGLFPAEKEVAAGGVEQECGTLRNLSDAFDLDLLPFERFSANKTTSQRAQPTTKKSTATATDKSVRPTQTSFYMVLILI